MSVSLALNWATIACTSYQVVQLPILQSVFLQELKYGYEKKKMVY